MNLIVFGQRFKYSLLFIIFFELLSFLSWYWLILQSITFWLIIIGILILAWKRLDLALGVVLVELIIGSKGYLFMWNFGSVTLSIRLGLFLAVLLIYLIKYFLKKRWEFRSSNIFWYYLALIIILFGGIIWAIFRGNEAKNIFFDANGFLYFGLIFIFFQVIKNFTDIKNLLQFIWAGVVAIALKTIILLFLFAGRFDFIPELYRWVRDTRVNEVTLIIQNFYRIFSQSQIWSLLILIVLLVIAALTEKSIFRNWKLFGLFSLTSLSVIISYSRSFWLSLAVVFLLILIFLINKYNYNFKKTSIYLSNIIIIIILEIGFIYLIINIPNWVRAGQGTASLASLVEERLGNTDEAALQSRWNLIKPLTQKIIRNPAIGFGFGTEITYQSKDPRQIAKNGGWYSTYSFEWGYLDIILKVGVIGLFIYLLFIWKILKNGIIAYTNAMADRKILILGLIFGLITLIIAHLTSPYLNHPLGIGYLMLVAIIFERLKNEPKQIEQQQIN